MFDSSNDKTPTSRQQYHHHPIVTATNSPIYNSRNHPYTTQQPTNRKFLNKQLSFHDHANESQDQYTYHSLQETTRNPYSTNTLLADPSLPKHLLSDEAMHYANASRIESKWANTRQFLFITISSFSVTVFLQIFLLPLMPTLDPGFTNIARIINGSLAFLTVFQFSVTFWESNVRPTAFSKMSTAISKLNNVQRKLFNVDPDIARLVDVIQPSLSNPAENANDSQQEPIQVPIPTRNTTRIQLRPAAATPRNTTFIPNTSDIRYSLANSVFVNDTMNLDPSRVPQQSKSPSSKLKIPIKSIFQTYQRSAAPTAEEQKVAGYQLSIIAPDDALRYFGTNPTQLSIWVENLRDWLAIKIFVPLVQDMTKVEQYLELKGWQHLSLYNTVQAVDLVATNVQGSSTNPSTFTTSFGFGQSGFGASNVGHPNSLNGLAQQAAKEPLARLRIQLERYLYMSHYPATARGYIIRRIIELSIGRSLAKFAWNTGGCLGNGKQWTPIVLPTDAELVMHVFSTWIDTQMPGSANAVTYAPFSTKYIRWSIDQMKENILNQWTIVMSDKIPHFSLGFNKTLYDVFPRRNNVFATIALFTYRINTECSGYIDMLDIGGKVIGLTDILKTDD